MNRRAVWALGVGVSLAAHAALFSFISLSVEPDPVQNQPVPTSRLDVRTYEVERTRARESAPDAQVATAEQGERTTLRQAVIPQSHSKGDSPRMQALPASTPSTVALAALVPVAALLGAERPASSRMAAQAPAGADLLPLAIMASAVAVLAPAKVLLEAEVPVFSRVATKSPKTVDLQSHPIMASTVAVLAPVAPLLNAERPASSRVFAQSPEAAQLQSLATLASTVAVLTPAAVHLTSEHLVTQAFQPVAYQTLDSPPLDIKATATALSPAPGKQDTAKYIRPSALSLTQAKRDADRVASLALPAQRATATLAFSGDDLGDVDPVSLAAIQSFMQAGDLRTSASAVGTVRDAISELLSQVPCARLQVSFVPETGTLQVNGHIPESGLRAPVLAALQAQVGPDIGLTDKLLILPRPQCGALAGIVAVGLAQSTDQITNPLLIGEDTQAREFQYVAGERLILDIAAPDYDAFIYVDYFDAAGQVIHLTPNETVPLESFAATEVLQVGADKISGQSLNITIGPPYGQEIAVAFATSVPLYDGVRPLTERAAPYLDWMRARVAKARETHADFKGEWVYFFVTTRSM
ncbi:MAG: DUF4384 domain-containing protein [Paracoccaceae bacterium]